MKQFYLIIILIAAAFIQANEAEEAMYYKEFGKFTQNQILMLEEDGFFVLSKPHRHMYHIYEVNQYYRLPSFITVDSALQWWYWTYKAVLQTMELQIIIPRIEKSIKALAEELPKINPERMSTVVRNDFYHIAAYLKVAAELQGVQMRVPPEASKLAEKELALIRAHAGIIKSPIFGYDIDYTRFIVRGYYNEKPELKKYFLVATWFSNGGFSLYTKNKILKNNITSVRKAAILIYLLNNAKIGKKTSAEIFIELDELLDEMIGKSWGYRIKDFILKFNDVIGNKNFFKLIEEDNLVRSFIIEWNRPDVPYMKSHILGAPEEPLFRLMSYRYQIDMFKLEELVKWPERPLPSGLDIPAIFGNKLAYEYLTKVIKVADQWSEYPKKLKKIQARIESPSNIVEQWLECLNIYLNNVPEKAPYFMHNKKWQYKMLESYLASWAELRHSLVLYTLEAMAECDYSHDKMPIGYVEPRPDVYSVLQKLIAKLKLIFSNESIDIGEDKEILNHLFDEADSIFKFLEQVANKELMGKSLEQEEISRIYRYGAEMETFYIESLSLNSVGIRLTKEARDMALIVDVARGYNKVLEVGVGLANEVYAIVPILNKDTIVRGAVFSYYEFEMPYSERLTDERWKQMLKQGTDKPQPDFTKMYRSFEDHSIPKSNNVALDCWVDFPYDELEKIK